MGAYSRRTGRTPASCLDGDGLHPTSRGKRVAFDGTPTAPSSTDPLKRPANWSPAIWLWQVKDMDEAVERFKRSSNPMLGPSEVEIRPLFEPADFGEAMTPELAGQEQCLRDQIAGN